MHSGDVSRFTLNMDWEPRGQVPYKPGDQSPGILWAGKRGAAGLGAREPRGQGRSRVRPGPGRPAPLTHHTDPAPKPKRNGWKPSWVRPGPWPRPCPQAWAESNGNPIALPWQSDRNPMANPIASPMAHCHTNWFNKCMNKCHLDLFKSCRALPRLPDAFWNN